MPPKTSRKPTRREREERFRCVYLLKVTLDDIEPPIWRRFEMRGGGSLGDLHEVLQVVMGWEDDHPHDFRVGDRLYGPVYPSARVRVTDEDEVTLNSLGLRTGSKLTYRYDFGDGWEHEILVEGSRPAAPGERAARCLEGERACPPEDCGGPGGYEWLLQIRSDPKHPEYEESLDWLGPYDPEAFDLEEVNGRLGAR